MNIVSKQDYWTTILNDPTQIGQITTEDTEFNRRINDVNLVLSNTFINSSDENIISRWESSLYIDDIEGKTITERKADILYTLCEKNYVPVSIIKRFLTNLIGNENKFAIEFIKNENRLIIHTDRISNELIGCINTLLDSVMPYNIEVEQYNHNIDISWRDINKYAQCVSVDDIISVNSDYKNDLTSEGEWIYPLPNLSAVPQASPYFFEGSSLRKIDIELPKLITGGCFLAYADKLEEARVIMPKATGGVGRLFEGTSIKKFYVEAPLATANGFAFCKCPNVEEITGEHFKTGKLSSADYFAWNSKNLKRIAVDFTDVGWCTYISNSPMLSSFESTLPKVFVAQSAFYGTILDKPSALRILTSLPPYVGDSAPARPNGQYRLGIGIHVDHKQDEEILAAITSLESNWWELTVQWNGTPTSTTSTMTMGQLIYAKVGEMERPDGTTEQYLDWAHYVTDETGYEIFRSLESAYKYFNLEQPTEI